MSLSVKYDDKMSPVSFGQKIKLSEGSEERELCLDNGNFIYRVTRVKGTLVPTVKSINTSDFRNPRKKIKSKRPSAVYRNLEFTCSLDDSKTGQVNNVKSVYHLRQHNPFVDRSFAMSFISALYYHPYYSIENTFRNLIKEKVDNSVDIIFFKELPSEYFYKDQITAGRGSLQTSYDG